LLKDNDGDEECVGLVGVALGEDVLVKNWMDHKIYLIETQKKSMKILWLLQSMKRMLLKGHKKESTMLRLVLQLHVLNMIPQWSEQSLFPLQIRYNQWKLHYLKRGSKSQQELKIKRPHPNVL
jgi:hypothetical protein